MSPVFLPGSWWPACARPVRLARAERMLNRFRGTPSTWWRRAPLPGYGFSDARISLGGFFGFGDLLHAPGRSAIRVRGARGQTRGSWITEPLARILHALRRAPERHAPAAPRDGGQPGVPGGDFTETFVHGGCFYTALFGLPIHASGFCRARGSEAAEAFLRGHQGQVEPDHPLARGERAVPAVDSGLRRRRGVRGRTEFLRGQSR